ncbi:MAG TPA: VOC family protein [Steroidobacteraceae bacterium]|nr:VOC family protein [Steroidobacteraceae bacterium]
MSLELKHHHGGISVPDLDASIRWFADVLGFKVESRFEIPAIPAKVAMLRRGDLRVELFEVPGAKGLPEERRQPNTDLLTHGNKHLAFAVKDADATAEVLRQRGADIVFVGHFEWGANVFVRDNAGNLIEFVQQPEMWA